MNPLGALLPRELQGDLRLLELAALLWWWADNVYRPSPLWRALGLWHPQTLGQLAAPDPTPGGGPKLSADLCGPQLGDAHADSDPSVAEFDRVADSYADVVAPYTRPIFEAALKRIGPRLDPAARVLDPSAGPGREAVALARLVPRGEVVAADLSRGMVAHAAAHAAEQRVDNMAFVAGGVADPPHVFLGAFDAVFSMLAFHHYPDGPAAAAGMRRALRPGGQAFIVDLGTDWAKALARPVASRLDPGFVQHRTGAEFVALFEEAGFRDLYWEEILPGMGLTIATA